MISVALVVLAYLIGSVSFAVIVSRAWGLPDPRTYGSGNPGATNVLRAGRKAAAALTLLGDGAKGWLAVVLAQRYSLPEHMEWVSALAAVAVVIGHMYPVFFRFDGGKGVATALGVLLALDYYVAAGAAATWIIIAFFFRISSLAALISALFAPFFYFLLFGLHAHTYAIAVVSLLLVYRHRANIRNLLQGTESRISGTRSGAQDPDQPVKS
jgi:glycerol-3-phosphate acyltransferase PlsY